MDELFEAFDIQLIAIDISPDGEIHFNGESFSISEEIDRMEETLWSEFLLPLGYSEEKAKQWAAGYASFLRAADDPLEQLRGIVFMYAPALEAGFEAAEINSVEAMMRYRAITEGPVGEA